MPSLLLVPEFFFQKEFLLTPVIYSCFAILTGDFLNYVKLGILILITNMASKIQIDVRIRKTIKKEICQYFGDSKTFRTLDKRSVSRHLQNQTTDF